MFELSSCKLKVIHASPRNPDYKIKNCEGKTLWLRQEGLGTCSLSFGTRGSAQKYIDSGAVNDGLKAKELFWRQ